MSSALFVSSAGFAPLTNHRTGCETDSSAATAVTGRYATEVGRAINLAGPVHARFSTPLRFESLETRVVLQHAPSRHVVHYSTLLPSHSLSDGCYGVTLNTVPSPLAPPALVVPYRFPFLSRTSPLGQYPSPLWPPKL